MSRRSNGSPQRRLLRLVLLTSWALPDCIGLHLVTGDDDAVLHLAVSDAERLRQVVIRQISSFPEVFDERTSLLFEHRRKVMIEPA
jgi:DNA-binding Lrp family transcriptional regulator